MKHIGDLTVTEDTKLDGITEVTGYLSVHGDAKLDALTSVGGDLYVYGEVKLNALTSVGGDLRVYGEAKLDAPALTSVGGDLRVYGEVKLNALTSVGGYLSVHGDAKLDALTSVGGDLYVDGEAKLDAPALTSVGGYLSVHGEAKLDAPALTSVGCYIRVYGEAKLSKNIQQDCGASLRMSIRLSVRVRFMDNGFLFADGILGKILAKKEINGNIVYTLAVKGGQKQIYCVEKGDQFSHGDTVEDAIKSLRYKLSDRDTTRFKTWKLSDTVSAEDAIQAYRAITGACETGVRMFCESRSIPENLTVAEAIKITEGKYNSEQFAVFFGGK